MINQSRYPYLHIDDLMEWIDSENRPACQKLLNDNRKLFEQAYGSVHNHQSWPGGYLHHIEEIMNLAIILFDPLSETGRCLDFNLYNAMLVLFLHDLEKPWKYELLSDGQLHHKHLLKTKAQAKAFREIKIAEYGIKLTPQEQNALTYAEGELSDYSSQKRVMNPLAAFCHMCDVASARIFFNHPLKENEPWQ